MSENEKPRTAVEIAMDRLKQRDAESGTADVPPTDAQKAAIAEARSLHAAKTAELKILHRSKLSAELDPADRQRIEDQYRDEFRRLNDECDRKVRKIRQPG